MVNGCIQANGTEGNSKLSALAPASFVHILTHF